jgi:hypothetical protein
MTSPLYGNQYSKKFNATFYMKPYTAATTKPATAVLALSTLDGTAAVNTFICDGVIDGDYIVASSPTNGYCIWIAGAGSDTNKPTAPTGCTAYLKVSVATLDLDTEDVVGAAIAAVVNTTDDLTATYTAGTNTLVITAVQGGARVLASSIAGVATAGSWAVTDTAGVGSWMKIGGVAEDFSFEPAPNEIRDSTGNKITTYEDMDISYELMNVNQRNFDILKALNRSQVSIAVMDKSSTSYPKIFCLDDLTLNVSFTPSGDTARIPIMLSKRTEDVISGSYFWTYDTDLV